MSTGKNKMYQWNDLGNAERLVDTYGKVTRYVPDWRTWMYYDGVRWVRVSDVFMNGLAKQVIKDMWNEVNTMPSNTAQEQEQKTRFVNWVRACGYGGHTELMIKQARDAVLAQPEDFDSNSWLVNTENFTVNLLTSETHEHTPNDMITKLTGTSYQPLHEGSRFYQFLDEVFNGDKETIKYAQKILGYSLSGVIREQHIFMPYGSGRNGKTVLFEIVAEVMGDYAAIGDTDLILDQGKFSNKN